VKRVFINPSKFSKAAFEQACGLYVLKLESLDEVQRRDQEKWSPDQFLVFYGRGRGHEWLFKRLRDTFAHGHFSSSKRGWITIRHRYKDSHEKTARTRLFGNLKVTTLKKLIGFLDVAAKCTT
jgi:hypothetical protein